MTPSIRATVTPALALVQALALALVWCWARPVLADTLQEAETAYAAAQYVQAAALLEPLAEQGVAEAQFTLGLIRHFGEGAPADEAAALLWFRRLAAGGYADPARDVRALFRVGARVPDGDPLGVYSYKKAAQNGDAEAQFVFAKIYDQGLGVIENDNLAAIWYRTAALQHHAAAAAHLGAMLAYGDGVPRELKSGVDFLLAGGQGFMEQGQLAEALVCLAMVKALAPGQHRATLLEQRIDERLAAR